MSDLPTFLRDINRFADSIGIKTETVIKKLSLQVFTGVVQKTPVDTGRARSAWVIGINKAEDSPDVEGETFTAGSATAKAMGQIASLSQIGPFSKVFISNSLPYIVSLEDGSSTQAPEGMVAVTLAEADMELKRLVNAV